jgi:hypothetical protein
MVGTSGRRSSLEAFAATGERRQLFARDTTLPIDAALVRIEVGQAPELRSRARGGVLICPIPSCLDPRYTTSGGSRRDHFVHMSTRGGGHSPESWFHYTGKRLVGQWLRGRHPDARVVVDEEAIENRQIPDVLAEFPDGRRFAFEVQYAALTVDEWTRRHEGYRSHGIEDVWLLGHTSRYFREARAEYLAGRVVLGPISSALWDGHLGPYWINPDAGTVATALEWTDGWRSGVPRLPAPHDVAVGIDALADCRIGEKGFSTPTDIFEQAVAARIEAQRAERERRQNEARLRREAEREASRQERERRLAYRESREEEERIVYEAGLRVELVSKSGPLMSVLETKLESDWGIRRYYAAWHGRFFLDRIHGKVGQSFSYAQACGPWMSCGDRDHVFAAVTGFLFHLRRHGLVSFDSRGSRVLEPICLIGDAD